MLVFIIVTSACSEVRFSQPQPLNGEELDEFPSQFIGQYLGNDGDTLVVNSTCFYYSDDEVKKLCNNRVTLKKKGNLHILSCKEILMAGEKLDRKGWEVLPFELIGDSLIVYFLDTTNDDVCIETIDQLEKIIAVEKIYTPDKKVEYFYIDPTIKQFEQILSSECFSVAQKFIRLN